MDVGVLVMVGLDLMEHYLSQVGVVVINIQELCNLVDNQLDIL